MFLKPNKGLTFVTQPILAEAEGKIKGKEEWEWTSVQSAAANEMPRSSETRMR